MQLPIKFRQYKPPITTYFANCACNQIVIFVELTLLFVFVQETDIGWHVNGLRKHPSAEVIRRLVE
jgi:hypothetical protein